MGMGMAMFWSGLIEYGGSNYSFSIQTHTIVQVVRGVSTISHWFVPSSTIPTTPTSPLPIPTSISFFHLLLFPHHHQQQQQHHEQHHLL